VRIRHNETATRVAVCYGQAFSNPAYLLVTTRAALALRHGMASARPRVMTNISKVARTSTEPDTRTIDEVLANARLLLAERERDLAELERQAKLAKVRGTRDLPRVNLDTPLEDQVAQSLRDEPMNAMALAAKLGVPVGRITPILTVLKDALKIHNIGSEVDPAWQHVIGDADGNSPEVRALVRKLIERRPFTHRELVVVTGARENKVSGAIADLREDKALRMRIVNLGSKTIGKWFILPDDIKPAPLRRSNGRR
jgi:hypothetical protein